MILLRHYQQSAVADLRAAFAGGSRAPLLVAPTGAGKTVILSAIAAGSQALGKRTLIVAHRRELIRQASAKLMDANVQHGVVAPGFTPDNSAATQVASIQTIGRRLETLRSFDLIVIDEAHHSIAGQYRRLIEAQPNALVMGVTATPERLDGRALGRSCGGVFDVIVLGPSVAELVAGGFLVSSRIFAPPDTPDLSGVRTKMGDYDTAGLVDVMDAPTLTGCAVSHYARHASGLPAIAFCITVQHAENVASSFRAAGWRATCAHGGLKPADRDAAIGGLATGAVQVLTTCDLISEGLDVPAVGAVILLRPTKSLGLYMQQVGRGLRPAPGKSHLIVLDHAGCTLSHGLPDTDREWSLDGRKAKKRPPPPVKQCPACFAMHRPGPICPECGHSYFSAERPKSREIGQRDVDLAEIDPATIDRMRTAPLHTLVGSAKTAADLAVIAKARGYKYGWVNYILRARGNRQSSAA